MPERTVLPVRTGGRSTLLLSQRRDTPGRPCYGRRGPRPSRCSPRGTPGPRLHELLQYAYAVYYEQARQGRRPGLGEGLGAHRLQTACSLCACPAKCLQLLPEVPAELSAAAPAAAKVACARRHHDEAECLTGRGASTTAPRNGVISAASERGPSCPAAPPPVHEPRGSAESRLG